MTEDNFDDICNWDNLFKQSETFKNNKPYKFAFIEEILNRDFYEKLYETYPQYDKNDKKWFTSTQFSKSQWYRGWSHYESGYYSGEDEDPDLSPEWNRFYKFVHSKIFAENLI